MILLMLNLIMDCCTMRSFHALYVLLVLVTINLSFNNSSVVLGLRDITIDIEGDISTTACPVNFHMDHICYSIYSY